MCRFPAIAALPAGAARGGLPAARRAGGRPPMVIAWRPASERPMCRFPAIADLLAGADRGGLPVAVPASVRYGTERRNRVGEPGSPWVVIRVVNRARRGRADPLRGVGCAPLGGARWGGAGPPGVVNRGMSRAARGRADPLRGVGCRPIAGALRDDGGGDGA